jgi:uncharacterized membrane protein YidH (DUF202 family)
MTAAWPRLPRPRPVGTAAEVDSGLQPERTTMAWSRTALACVVVSAVFLRWLEFYGPALLLLPLLTLLAALAIAGTQHHRTRLGVHAIKHAELEVDPLPMVLLLFLAMVLGVAGVVFVVLA